MTALLLLHRRLQQVVRQRASYPLTLCNWLVRAVALKFLDSLVVCLEDPFLLLT